MDAVSVPGESGGIERRCATYVGAIDYFYFREEEKGRPDLQVKDSKSKMCWASPVPARGNDAFAVNFVMILDEVGYSRLIMKSDDEPSVKARP